MKEQVDTIIVGGGQGGLATSYHLKQQGRPHVILEQEEHAAAAWRKASGNEARRRKSI